MLHNLNFPEKVPLLVMFSLHIQRSRTTHFSAFSGTPGMDSVSKRFLIHGSEALSPITSPGSPIFHPHVHSSSTSFPIITIAVIGIFATAFLLVSYYIFVIKCCLSWHQIDLLRRFSPSRRHEDPLAMSVYSPGTERRGLEEAVIRLIPVIQYKKSKGNRDSGERSFCECAVCLNEFREDEKLRIIPNCSHAFHIDCIDIWLQNNANCPLCRTSISQIDLALSPRPPSSHQDRSPYSENPIVGDEDFVVIELGNDQNLQPEPGKLEQRIVQNKARKLQKVTSMGDESINVRAKDEQFSVQPIRRSFSMDSSGDRQFYLAVQEALQQQNRQATSIEGSISGSGRAKRLSFFSFGHGGRTRSAVLPVYLYT